jgi:hypothetical protein
MTAIALKTTRVQPLSVEMMKRVWADLKKYNAEELKAVVGEFCIGTLRASANLAVSYARKGFTIVNAFMFVGDEFAENELRRARARDAQAGGSRGKAGGGTANKREASPSKTTPITHKNPNAKVSATGPKIPFTFPTPGPKMGGQ